MLPHSLSAERVEDAAIEADRKKGIIRERRPIQVAIPNRPEARPSRERISSRSASIPNRLTLTQLPIPKRWGVGRASAVGS
jgi:hypothetical protein